MVCHITSGNETFYLSQPNFWSSSAAKTLLVNAIRLTEKKYVRQYYGALSSNALFDFANNSNYENKITKVKVGTTSTSGLQEGKITVYGRRIV